MRNALGGAPKLAVCWIWGSPFVWTKSVESMLGLRHPADVEVKFFRGNGWGPARRHINACEAALAWGADYFLILGADQVYEPDLLERLVARVREGFEVVAALVPTRGYVSWNDMKPFQPMAWRLRSNGLKPIRWGPDGAPIEAIDPNAGEMQRIDLIGSGVLLFQRGHLEALERPWFFEEIDPETQIRTACMDTRFVYRLHSEAYAQVWADCTIKVRHLHAFEIDDSFSERFADWEKPGAGPRDICDYRDPAVGTPAPSRLAEELLEAEEPVLVQGLA